MIYFENIIILPHPDYYAGLHCVQQQTHLHISDKCPVWFCSGDVVNDSAKKKDTVRQDYIDHTFQHTQATIQVPESPICHNDANIYQGG